MEHSSARDPVAEAWPGGPPAEVALALAALTEAARRDGVARLGAVQDYLRGDLSAEAAGAVAGLSGVRLRQIAQAWGRGDAFAVLGVRAGAGRERASTLSSRLGDAPSEVAEALRQLVRSRPGLSSKEALKAVRSLDLPLPSDRTLTRWLAKARRSEAAGRVMGRRLAFDARALRLATEDGGWHRAAFALDVGGSVVLGAVLVDAGQGIANSYRAAAVAGARSLPSMDLGTLRYAERLEAVSVAVPLVDQAMTMAAFFVAVRDVAGIAAEQARPGRAVVKVCGARLGRLALASGGVPPGEDVPVVDGATASILLDEALKEYHRDVATVLSADGEATNDGASAMAATLEAFAEHDIAGRALNTLRNAAHH